MAGVQKQLALQSGKAGVGIQSRQAVLFFALQAQHGLETAGHQEFTLFGQVLQRANLQAHCLQTAQMIGLSQAVQALWERQAAGIHRGVRGCYALRPVLAQQGSGGGQRRQAGDVFLV